MIVIKLYSELQVNPSSAATYRKLAKYYKSIGMINESEAFFDLIKKKFNVNHPNPDEKQPEDDIVNN